LLNSGTLDIDYLGKMLEFALATLRNLSAPANDRENESTHRDLLKELHRLCEAEDESGNFRAVAIVKGIRFILEQIQVCMYKLFFLHSSSSSAIALDRKKKYTFALLVHLSVSSFFILYPTGT